MTDTAADTPTAAIEQTIIDSARHSGTELAHLERHLAGLDDLCHDIRALAIKGHPNAVGTKLTELATKTNLAREIVDRASQFRAHAEGAGPTLPLGHPWENTLPVVITGHALAAIVDANG